MFSATPHWVYKMDDAKRAKYQNNDVLVIDGFGHRHKPSLSVWKTMSEKGYIKRMSRAIDLFNIPKGCSVVADVGCGPWAGVFYVRKWESMYAIDPSWQKYEQNRVIRLTCKKILQLIEDYAQFFKLPAPADLIFSINALNHGGDFRKSIENVMSNLKVGGLFFMHLHLRGKEEVDGGHPIAVSDDDILNTISTYNIISSKIYDYDPLKIDRGHRSIVATLIKG